MIDYISYNKINGYLVIELTKRRDYEVTIEWLSYTPIPFSLRQLHLDLRVFTCFVSTKPCHIKIRDMRNNSSEFTLL